MSLTTDFELGKEVKQLAKVGKLFGVGSNLEKQVETRLEDVSTKVDEWANQTKEMMTKTNINVPVESGNLRDSITIDKSNGPMKTFVGVDLEKLKQGKVYDDHDYTEEANEANAEGRGHLEREFIQAIWHENAKVIANKKGFSSNGVVLKRHYPEK